MTIKTVERPSDNVKTPTSVIEALRKTADTGEAIEVEIGEMQPINWQSNIRYHLRKYNLKLKYRVKDKHTVVAWAEKGK